MAGPYVYRIPNFTTRTSFIGIDHECVSLVRKLTGAPDHRQWTEGAKLTDANLLDDIAPGTAIATFSHGIYASLPHGNHAALFVRALQDGKGFVVFDQWRRGDHLPQQRTLYFNRPGNHNASDRAEAYSVIK